MKHTTLLLIVFLFASSVGLGQELNCRVIVNDQQVQTTERDIFREMETEFAQFLNTTKWTDDDFAESEVIKCNIVITITEMPNVGFFNATVQVLSTRPVYNSNYESLVLNFADRDWSFEYLQSQPLQFSENVFTNEISSLLSYYAYLILGFDYDTFSELGGSAFFQQAFQIVNNAQQSSSSGWQQFNSIRNRYWMIENIQSPQLEPIRKALYTYHREGLDLMIEDKETAEKNMVAALSSIQKANRARPRSILTISFIDAKATEIVQAFTDSGLATKRQVYNILNGLDPSRSNEFKPLIE